MLWHVGAWGPWKMGPSGCLVYFFPPFIYDLAAILIGQTTASPSEALQILEQNKRGKLVFHRCNMFLDEEALFLTSTIMLSSSTHRGICELPHFQQAVQGILV